MARRQTKVDGWKYRRALIFATWAFCAIIIADMVFFATSDSLREHAIMGAFALMGTVVTGYVFGAVVDDHLQRKQEDNSDGR